MTRPEIEKQLAKILASELFRGGARSKGTPRTAELLRFLITRKLDKRPISDAIVTREFYGKEPQTFIQGELNGEAIGRAGVYNLRKRLNEYYATQGLNDLIRIDIPKGAFVPVMNYVSRSPANREVILGLAHLDRESPSNIREAIRHFDQAIILEPDFAEAYAGKASALTTLLLHEFTAAPDETLTAAEEAGKKALELQSDLWRAHAALCGVYLFRQEWKLADAHCEAAIASNAPEAREDGIYGSYLLGRGHYDEALALAKQYEDDHPAEVTFLRRAALYHYALRQYAEAQRLLDVIMVLDYNLWYIHLLMGFVYLAKENPVQALYRARDVEVLALIDLWPGFHTLCLVRSGFREEAQLQFNKFSSFEKVYVKPSQLALGHMALGNADMAIEQLERGARDGDPFILWLHLWPLLDPLRSHAGFQDLLRRLGLPEPPPKKHLYQARVT